VDSHAHIVPGATDATTDGTNAGLDIAYRRAIPAVANRGMKLLV
jgi:hypothetical protein